MSPDPYIRTDPLPGIEPPLPPGPDGRRVTTVKGQDNNEQYRDGERWPVPCTVLDPFAGSGTTLLVARQHGRHAIGIELNESYVQLASDRLAQQSLLADAANG